MRGIERSSGYPVTGSGWDERAEPPLDDFYNWLDGRFERHNFDVQRIPLGELERWHTVADTGNIAHETGKFFTIEGLRVHTNAGPVSEWSQPIINQPEVGILGIIIKDFGGVLHCLMQCKMEPGNINILQMSPTVQATRSNYTRVHEGAEVRYLEYFTGHHKNSSRLVDVLQSEHGSWFYRKRNRNMIVEVTEEIRVEEDFYWLTLAQVGHLLKTNNLVNMDARTVLSCLPLAPDLQLGNSLTATQGLSWFTEVCAMRSVSAQRVPLAEVTGWTRFDDEIRNDDGSHFSVIGISVTSTSREVAHWTQPMFRPLERGIVAFVVRRFGEDMHVLAHARTEPGFVDVVEIGPTVQYQPSSYAGLQAPPFADVVLEAPPDRVLYDVVLSEEGGRFYHPENRYMVVELGEDIVLDPPADYRWIPVQEISQLIAHRNYLNIQARTLLAVLHLTLGLL